ncbi:MAG: acetyltransferase [Methylophaga sp.]|nr:acetyltransferase [Methylophaga sp.]
MASSEKKQLVIFGAGGHAKSVISVIHDEGLWDVVGLVTDNHGHVVKAVMDYPVFQGREHLLRLFSDGVKHAFIAVGDDSFRQKISPQLKELGFELVNIIHPTALVMSGAMLEDGILLHAYSLVGAESKIASGVIIQPYVSIGHESHIGAYSQLSPGARVGGDCRIGTCCFLGPNAVVFPKVSIGDFVSIGANSTVNKDVPDHQTILSKATRMISKSINKRSADENQI